MFREVFFVSEGHRNPRHTARIYAISIILCIAKRVTENGVNSDLIWIFRSVMNSLALILKLVYTYPGQVKLFIFVVLHGSLHFKKERNLTYEIYISRSFPSHRGQKIQCFFPGSCLL